MCPQPFRKRHSGCNGQKPIVRYKKKKKEKTRQRENSPRAHSNRSYPCACRFRFVYSRKKLKPRGREEGKPWPSSATCLPCPRRDREISNGMECVGQQSRSNLDVVTRCFYSIAMIILIIIIIIFIIRSVFALGKRLERMFRVVPTHASSRILSTRRTRLERSVSLPTFSAPLKGRLQPIESLPGAREKLQPDGTNGHICVNIVHKTLASSSSFRVLSFFQLNFIRSVSCQLYSVVISISLLLTPSKLGHSFICSSPCTLPHPRTSSSDESRLYELLLVRPRFTSDPVNCPPKVPGESCPSMRFLFWFRYHRAILITFPCVITPSFYSLPVCFSF